MIPAGYRLVMIGLLAAAGWTIPSPGVTLYYTDFDEFTPGTNTWGGQQGWLINGSHPGVHGIDQELIPGAGLSNTAFLGFSQPTARVVRIIRPIQYNPATNNVPLIEFSSIFGIKESNNGFHDSFLYSFFDTGGVFMASVEFETSALGYGSVFRWQGTNLQADTGVDFNLGSDIDLNWPLYELIASIDLASNRWSAALGTSSGDIPLFDNAAFSTNTSGVALGYIVVEWLLSSASPFQHGDNWLLAIDFSVNAFPRTDEHEAGTAGIDPGGEFSLSWPGAYGFDYALEHAGVDMVWITNAPLYTCSNVLSATNLVYVETNDVNVRHYRIRRTLSDN